MNDILKIPLTMLLSFPIGFALGFMAARLSHKVTARIRKKKEARRIDKMIRDTRNLIESTEDCPCRTCEDMSNWAWCGPGGGSNANE